MSIWHGWWECDESTMIRRCAVLCCRRINANLFNLFAHTECWGYHHHPINPFNPLFYRINLKTGILSSCWETQAGLAQSRTSSAFSEVMRQLWSEHKLLTYYLFNNLNTHKTTQDEGRTLHLPYLARDIRNIVFSPCDLCVYIHTHRMWGYIYEDILATLALIWSTAIATGFLRTLGQVVKCFITFKSHLIQQRSSYE